MGSYIKNLLLLLLIFFYSTTVFSGIVMPIIPMYFLSTLVVLSMGIMLTKPFLEFLTIKVNFLTYFLMSALITIGNTFLLKIFMTGFFVEGSNFDGLSLDFLKVEGFQVSAIFTIILFAVLSAFISTIFYSLEKLD